MILCVGIQSKKINQGNQIKYMSHYVDILKKYPKVNELSQSDYIPIQFSSIINPDSYLYYFPNEGIEDVFGNKINHSDLDGKIGEFWYNVKDQNWELQRLRLDKEGFGNDYMVASMTFDMYFNPLTIDDISTSSIDDNISGVGKKDYFNVKKNSIYKAPTAFNSFIKGLLINSFKNLPLVIDLASGQGQDLFRYDKSYIKNIIFTDSDPTALQELNQRVLNPRFSGKMNVFTQLLNLNDDYNENYSKINKIINKNSFSNTKILGISCMFAIHYMCDSTESIKNLIALIDNLLSVGGRFIFTCFDGKKIFNLLKSRKEDDPINWYEDNFLKYSLKRKFKSNSVSDAGQMIGVKLPFSGDQYYEEYLVNLDYIIDIFIARGYKLELRDSFSEYKGKFKEANTSVYSELTDDDIMYNSLYSTVVLFKERDLLKKYSDKDLKNVKIKESTKKSVKEKEKEPVKGKGKDKGKDKGKEPISEEKNSISEDESESEYEYYECTCGQEDCICDQDDKKSEKNLISEKKSEEKSEENSESEYEYYECTCGQDDCICNQDDIYVPKPGDNNQLYTMWTDPHYSKLKTTFIKGIINDIGFKNTFNFQKIFKNYINELIETKNIIKDDELYEKLRLKAQQLYNTQQWKTQIQEKEDVINNQIANNTYITREKRRVDDIEEKLLNKYKNIIPKKIQSYLDIGSSEGKITAEFGKHLVEKYNMPKTSINGTDIVDPSRAYGNTNITLGQSNTIDNYPVNFKLIDVETSPNHYDFEDNSQDIITAMMSLHHIPNVKKSLEDIYRMLKPGGLFIIREHDNSPLELNVL